MKLYYHPVSTTCRPIMLLAACNGIKLDYELVDLFTGQHVTPQYALINPSQQVPVLEDGDFRLTESSAIMKYLADSSNSPAYPKDLRQRARVNELMDWFNTGFYRDYGYGFIYPQLLPNLRRPDPVVHAGTVEWGSAKARHWLQVLDENILGPHRDWLVGDHLTIADWFGACLVTVGEVIRLDLAPYRNITRWLGNVKARPEWGPTNEGFYAHFVAPFKDGNFQRL